MGRGLTHTTGPGTSVKPLEQRTASVQHWRARAQTGSPEPAWEAGAPSQQGSTGTPFSSPPELRRTVRAQFSAPYTTHATKTIKIIEISESHLLIYPTTPSNQEWPSLTDVCKRYAELLRI
ncbi:uncharacterized protein ZBAI_05840 [Zygosaccharomyces bailii ISA1307]|nr:uncharacterized protein ZBAI_05840 [Zygosaccharomyces bailii ISA1307]